MADEGGSTESMAIHEPESWKRCNMQLELRRSWSICLEGSFIEASLNSVFCFFFFFSKSGGFVVFR
jgi:hypothetical protein